MHYLFIDESYPPVESGKTISMAAWIVAQDKFDNFFPKIHDLYRTPVLASIDSMLETVDGLAVVAHASLSHDIFRVDEIDSTDDISTMARTDNIWSECLIFLAGKVIKESIRRNREIEIIDIYHDPKSLKADHAIAMIKTLSDQVVSMAKQYVLESNILLLDHLEIRHIKAVEKSQGKQPNIFQVGTWVSDKLCGLKCDSVKSKEFSRIIVKDISELVRRTAQQFDGKSFEED
jgi:hypothetical protein